MISNVRDIAQRIHSHRLANGLMLLAEPMDWLESVAVALVVPAGCSRDPADRAGLANFTAEMAQRGCGSRDSRQFVEDLERLGVDHWASVSNAHASFGGAMPAERLRDALPMYADLLQRPLLPEAQLDDARAVCMQEVRSIEDDPGQKVMLELRMRAYPEPYGRSPQGTVESLERIAMDDIQRFYDAAYRPDETIISVAGKLDWPRMNDQVEALFSGWSSRPLAPLVESSADGRCHHIPHESAQTHIGVAFPSVAYADPDYFQARGAVGVLSDGMSSRLFTEVRENRGLCYSVHAGLHSLRDRAGVFCYAGTSTERAQETLNVIIAELRKLAQGVHDDELARLKAQIKSSLIMQQESSRSRSAAMAGDWYHLGRVRTLDELGGIIDALSCESINAYLAAHPPAQFTVVTLGASPLELPDGVS
jgi:predicted Zn-dependent peptidase